MTNDIDAIRQRAEAATPGPWRWYGNTDVQRIYLSTVRWGRQLVMGFERWGMQSAQPSFVDGRTWKPEPESGFDFGVSGWVKPARDLPVYEVAPNATSRKDPDVYRADIRGVRNPDAEFIAHARQDVDDLLAKIDELTADVESLDDDISAVRTERDALAAKVAAFKPVAYPSGEQLYAHRCNNVEWWNESTLGPINEQGCDACESAPDGTWRPVYVRAGA